MVTIGKLTHALAVASAVGPVPTAPETCLAQSRVRFWVQTGGLPQLPAKSRGHGRKRQFSDDSLHLVVALGALADVGVPSHRFGDIARQIANHPSWPKAVGGAPGINLTVALAKEESVVVLSDDEKNNKISLVGPTVTVNLSQLLSRVTVPDAKKAE